MNRRKVLLGSGVALSTIFAGCASDESGNENGNGNGNGSGNGDSDEPESSNDDGSGEDSAETEPETEDEPEEEETGNSDEEQQESVEEPDPQTFSGSGATVEDGISIEGGLTVVDASHDGESNFQVSLVDGSEFDDNFVNEIGQYDGETAALIGGGEYMLDVEADGSWEIEVRQPRAASGDSLPQSLSDDRNRVIGPVEFSGTHVASGEHSGSRNFVTEIFPAKGSFSELVFNEIGQYEGETTFSFDGVGWVAVQADGEWSLDLE